MISGVDKKNKKHDQWKMEKKGSFPQTIGKPTRTIVGSIVVHERLC